jgi:hypothetical protein
MNQWPPESAQEAVEGLIYKVEAGKIELPPS